MAHVNSINDIRTPHELIVVIRFIVIIICIISRIVIAFCKPVAVAAVICQFAKIFAGNKCIVGCNRYNHFTSADCHIRNRRILNGDTIVSRIFTGHCEGQTTQTIGHITFTVYFCIFNQFCHCTCLQIIGQNTVGKAEINLIAVICTGNHNGRIFLYIFLMLCI